MSSKRITSADLEAYLDEALLATDMARMETLLREREDLRQQLAQINARRDAGFHSLGEIWRRHRISCVTREQLGGYLLGASSESLSKYIAFHLEVVGCRLCQANFEDLRREQEESRDTAHQRRAKYFQTSAGHLKKGKKS